jgi:hypothetical protein
LARIGETLTNARVRRGLSIEQAAQDTRIAARFIAALEAEDFALLPAPVYVRGFLRSYATYLRIDPASLLSELPPERGPRVASPDRFVGGPPGPRGAPQRGADPFRRPGQAQPGTQPAGEDRDDYEESVSAPPPRRDQRPVIQTPVPPSERRGVVPQNEVYDDQPVRPRLAGVLVGRPGDDEGGSRVLILAGIGVLVLLVVLATAVFVTSRGGGDKSSSSINLPTATNTAKAGTIIAVGSPTATAKASGSAIATGTVTPTATGTSQGTPGATPTATPSATARPTGAATAPPVEDAATPTATPTQQPPTATPTKPPPTPKPSPTPTISHAYGFGECGTGGDCGDAPYRVICAPDGWFIDVNKDFANPGGWPVKSVSRPLDAQTVC